MTGDAGGKYNSGLLTDDEQSVLNGASGTGGASQDASQVQQGSASELAKKLLSYRSSHKYNCDNSGDCVDLQKMVDGQSLAGSGGCQAKALDPRVLQLLLYLIEVGNFRVGTYALCGDHGFDSPRGHSGGFAVDISSINGQAVNQDSQAAKMEALKMDKFLNALPAPLKLSQQISWGYGNHFDSQMAATQQYGGKLCSSSCESIYTAAVEAQHTNHIHAGY